MTEDKMVGWHHRLDGHEFVPMPGIILIPEYPDNKALFLSKAQNLEENI